MGFVDSLRMQNIFPNSKLQLGFTGKIPAYGGRDPLEDIVSRYQDLLPPQQTIEPSNRISQVADKLGQPQQPKMNVVFKDEMTPFQKQSLALRKSGQDNTRENQEANRELAGKRVGIAEFKAKNPNKRFIAVKGGNVMAFDPTTGEAEDTGINSGTLTDQERLEISQGHAEKMEGTRQTNRETLANVQHGNRMTEKQYDKDNPDDDWGNPLQTFNPDGTPGLLVQVNKKDGTTRRVQTPGVTRTTAPGTQPPLQPSQQINERKLKIQEVLAHNPDWSRYIDQESGQVKPVGTGYGSADLTEQKRNEIVEAIYGKGGDTNPPSNIPNNGGLPSNTPPVNNVVPPIEQRKLDQIYTLPNGRKAKWNGQNWVAQPNQE